MCVQFVEVCCLSEPGYVDCTFEFMRKYENIWRIWIGPYLLVVLTEAKYVEVSKLSLHL